VHGVDQRDDVVLLEVEVLDGRFEEFLFGGHGLYRITILDRTDADFARFSQFPEVGKCSRCVSKNAEGVKQNEQAVGTACSLILMGR
jgi:hypothetical protein